MISLFSLCSHIFAVAISELLPHFRNAVALEVSHFVQHKSGFVPRLVHSDTVTTEDVYVARTQHSRSTSTMSPFCVRAHCYKNDYEYSASHGQLPVQAAVLHNESRLQRRPAICQLCGTQRAYKIRGSVVQNRTAVFCNLQCVQQSRRQAAEHIHKEVQQFPAQTSFLPPEGSCFAASCK